MFGIWRPKTLSQKALTLALRKVGVTWKDVNEYLKLKFLYKEGERYSHICPAGCYDPANFPKILDDHPELSRVYLRKLKGVEDIDATPISKVEKAEHLKSLIELLEGGEIFPDDENVQRRTKTLYTMMLTTASHLGVPASIASYGCTG